MTTQNENRFPDLQLRGCSFNHTASVVDRGPSKGVGGRVSLNREHVPGQTRGTKRLPEQAQRTD